MEINNLFNKKNKKKLKCPNCNNTSLEDYYPFCSQKCSDLDLYKWLSDQNSINLDQKE